LDLQRGGAIQLRRETGPWEDGRRDRVLTSGDPDKYLVLAPVHGGVRARKICRHPRGVAAPLIVGIAVTLEGDTIRKSKRRTKVSGILHRVLDAGDTRRPD
jgi:hypothetical protein